MSLTADTVASQLLWPGDLLQSATVTIKVSWLWDGVRVEGQLLWPGDLLQSATVTIRSIGWSCGWGGVRGGRSNIRDWRSSVHVTDSCHCGLPASLAWRGVGGRGVEGQVLGAGGQVSMSLTAVTVAFQLLWPGELLQSVTVTIKVSWVGVV